MKILICGSTGFIGRNIAYSLSKNKNYKVYGTYYKSNPIKDSNINSIKINLTSEKNVDRITKGVDVIIQAAATTSGSKDIVQHPYLHVSDNAIMNSILLRSAFKNNVKKFIFFSCSVMYQSSNISLKEDDFNFNDTLHNNYFGVGWTKLYIERMCEFYASLGVTEHIVIRHSNIYGPFDKFDLNKSHVFGATINKVMDTTTDHVKVWGDGSEKRDLLYIDDLVDFINSVVKKSLGKFQLINIGSGSAISIKELVRKIIKISGKEKTIKFQHDKPTIKTSVILNYDKATKLLNWKPKVSLDMGIMKTIDWFKKNIIH